MFFSVTTIFDKQSNLFGTDIDPDTSTRLLIEILIDESSVPTFTENDELVALDTKGNLYNCEVQLELIPRIFHCNKLNAENTERAEGDTHVVPKKSTTTERNTTLGEDISDEKKPVHRSYFSTYPITSGLSIVIGVLTLAALYHNSERVMQKLFLVIEAYKIRLNH